MEKELIQVLVPTIKLSNFIICCKWFKPHVLQTELNEFFCFSNAFLKFFTILGALLLAHIFHLKTHLFKANGVFTR